MSKRLVGSDGELLTVTFGAALTGDGTSTLDELAGGASGSGAGEGWYRIDSISDGTTAFPAALAANDLWWDDGTTVLDAGTSSDDVVSPLVENRQCDVTSFSLDVSRAEIDVTTLCDEVKRYRGGKVDMTGSMEGITTTDVTDADGWVLNNFLRIISQAAAGTVTVNEIDDADIYIKGRLDKTETSGEKETFLWARVNILGTSLGASGEDAQSFTGSFRVAPGNPSPTYYIREIA